LLVVDLFSHHRSERVHPRHRRLHRGGSIGSLSVLL
jgi:hypothetical protein